MVRQISAAMLLVFATVAPAAAQHDYCGLLQQTGAIGLRPLSSAAEDIVKDLGAYAPFSVTNFRLFGVRDADLKSQGTAAQICNGNERYIFFDPDFVQALSANTRDWAKYFSFAHEVAHHINGDTLLRHETALVEFNADRAAAMWMVRRGASLQDILDAVDSLGLSDTPRTGYPSRCQRREGVIVAYNDEARMFNDRGGHMELYVACQCLAVEAGGGMFVSRALARKAPIQSRDLLTCNVNISTAVDIPRDYSKDVSGMCATEALRPGVRLTWTNIGPCTLMP